MDTQRLILFIIFSFAVLMLYEGWQRENRPAAPTTAQPAPAAPVPAPSAAPPIPTQAESVPEAVPGGAVAAPSRTPIRVETDYLRAEIDPTGGDIVHLELLRYRDSFDASKTYVLLGAEHKYAIQSGLIGHDLPTHKSAFVPRGMEYKLVDGQDAIEVKLDAMTPQGVRVTKTLRFKRASYVIQIAQEVSNGTTSQLTPQAYMHITRDGKSPADDKAMLQTYTGAAVFSEQDKFVKVSFSDMDKGKVSYTKTGDNGWIAMVQHYFVAALLPPAKAGREFYTERLADSFYRAGVKLPIGVVAPGATATATLEVYAGPQEQDKLKAVAPGLDLVVDYGWLTVIAAPLFWVLEQLHEWLRNWGLAIIALTVLIKLIFFPLSAASYKSMARMKQVMPRMTKLREQYGDDRAKLNQAMMELYKQEKINPLGGCLPIVVQIPVFIALYWVLLASVELRQAPFYGWIRDLSASDPYYILPALMMASMFVQTKMSPTPPDPVQAKVMMLMPFVFGFMFFFFPAGLVLYWLVNNILSIAQQWQINRMFEGGKAPARKS
jgi:YidC/Oxa1 family membrane protein insertase